VAAGPGAPAPSAQQAPGASAGIAAAAAQAAARNRVGEQAPRTQPAPVKPGDVAGAGNGQPAADAPARPGAAAPRAANGQPAESEGHAGVSRPPAGTGEGARHAAGGPRPDTADDTADNVRIVQE
jgi:hypothetical protein